MEFDELNVIAVQTKKIHLRVFPRTEQPMMGSLAGQDNVRTHVSLCIGTLHGILRFCMMFSMNLVIQCFRLGDTILGLRCRYLDAHFYTNDFTLNLGLAALKVNIRDCLMDTMCSTNKVDMTAPNIVVKTLEKVDKVLLDFQKPGRPLVVNFGSCT